MRIGKNRPPDRDRLLIIVDSTEGAYEYYVLEAKLRGRIRQPKRNLWITEDGMEFGTSEQAMAYIDRKADEAK